MQDFDFYKVFSRAFGEEEDRAGGDLEWKVGDVVTDHGLKPPRHQFGCMRFIKSIRFLI